MIHSIFFFVNEICFLKFLRCPSEIFASSGNSGITWYQKCSRPHNFFREIASLLETHNYPLRYYRAIHSMSLDIRTSESSWFRSRARRASSVTDDHCRDTLWEHFRISHWQTISSRALRNRKCRPVLVGNLGTIALKRLIKASAAIHHAALLSSIGTRLQTYFNMTIFNRYLTRTDCVRHSCNIVCICLT